MRVLNFLKFEVFFPVRTLFEKGLRAITHFDPLHRSIFQLPRLFHVPKIFVSGDRPSAERSVLNGLFERFFLTGLYFGSNEVSHNSNCTTMVA